VSGYLVDTNVDVEVARRWGELMAVRTLPTVDGLLAATALVHGLELVTRNVADVKGTGVRCFDPFVEHRPQDR